MSRRHVVRGSGWRATIVVLAIALVGATSVAAFWHGPHGADQDCAVCQLRQHSVVDLAGTPQLGTVGSPEPVRSVLHVRWIAPDPVDQTPSRAPPA